MRLQLLNKIAFKIFVGISLFSVFITQLHSNPSQNFMGKSYGLVLKTAEHGTGLGGFYAVNIEEKLQYQILGQFIDILGEAEMPVTDWFTGRTYKTNVKNLLLMPIYLGIKYYPFAGQIANNFNPYVTFHAGPDFIFDTAETGSFTKRWRNVNTLISYGVLIGGGVDFMLQGRSVFSVCIGYEFLPMGKVVDERDNYSGYSFKIMLGRFNRR